VWVSNRRSDGIYALFSTRFLVARGFLRGSPEDAAAVLHGETGTIITARVDGIELAEEAAPAKIRD
jgi:hypothetical protein